MHEHFICNQCGCRQHINYLTQRLTQSGNYCPACGHIETCAACGEEVESKNIQYKPDVQNYICNNCNEHYLEVKQYIKPISTGSYQLSVARDGALRIAS